MLSRYRQLEGEKVSALGSGDLNAVLPCALRFEEQLNETQRTGQDRIEIATSQRAHLFPFQLPISAQHRADDHRTRWHLAATIRATGTKFRLAVTRTMAA